MNFEEKIARKFIIYEIRKPTQLKIKNNNIKIYFYIINLFYLY